MRDAVPAAEAAAAEEADRAALVDLVAHPEPRKPRRAGLVGGLWQ